MKFYIQGQGPVTLTDKQFVTEGGEGKIYAKDDWVYKIYTNPAKMLPVGKIQELAVLDNPNIVRPKEILLDNQDQPVGFTMARVAQSLPLARLFTNDFRNRYGISADNIVRLVANIQTTIAFIHSQGCLIVDGNEMNYLINENNPTEPFFIDVDSYQTPSFPATAITPSIRDWQSKNFTVLSDWFSFAVIACQLFIGIHPFKGRHPAFKKNDLEGRMKANASIFNRQVSLPAAARDFSYIPAAYRDWFLALFEQGRREPPPRLTDQPYWFANSRTVQTTHEGNEDFIIDLIQTYPDNIVRVTAYNGQRAVMTHKTVHIDKLIRPLPAPDVQIFFAPRSLTPLLAWPEAGHLNILNARTGKLLAHSLKADRIMIVENILYVLQYDNLIAVHMSEFKNKIIISPGQIWKVLPKAVIVLQSLIYQNILGKPHLLIPYKPGCCRITATPELEGYKIIDGRWEGGIAVIIAHKNDCYDRFVFKFNAEHTRYKLKVEKNMDLPMIHFVTLDNGIVVNSNEDTMEISSSRFDYDMTRTLRKNTALANADIILAKDGSSALFFQENRLYSLKTHS